MQAELNLARRRAHGIDKTERRICNIVVGVPITGDVEDIEEISPETEHMLLFPNVKVLE